MHTERKVKRALISVSDKTGLVELARTLDRLGIEIISTGGTLRTLREKEIHAIAVSTFTGSPEVMGGRVKTLHPKIHGGILFRRDSSADLSELETLDSKPIDLVIVNLYPFQETISRPNVSESEAIENIDIGGPSLLRSAAKNHQSVVVIVDPADYQELSEQLSGRDRSTTSEFRRRMAQKAFALTSQYDAAIAGYLDGLSPDVRFPKSLNLIYTFGQELRYGENPHQSGALYKSSRPVAISLVGQEMLSGKELSYNNYCDLEACLDLLSEFSKPFACIVKHTNPCGAACADDLASAYQFAYETDPLSAFGSIIGLNRVVTFDAATLLHETEFVECIIAPGYEPEALELLRKKKNRRLLALPDISKLLTPSTDLSIRSIRGGLLVQSPDTLKHGEENGRVVTKRPPGESELVSLAFAWRIAKQTKSNAIVLAKGERTVGIGMGQTSRVDSSFMAVKRAGERASGAVIASDAFFPMTDGLQVALEAGVTAVIQPGGSKGDQEVIELADKYNAAMIFTGIRHFKH